MPEPPNDLLTLNAALREAQAENDCLRQRNRVLATLVLAYETQKARATKENEDTK